MEKGFKTIEEIKNKFSLVSDSNIEIRKELIKKISEIHPDKNNGSFANTETEILYNNISSAIEFIDNELKNEQQLIPISAIKEITNLIKEIIPVNNTTTEKLLEMKSELLSLSDKRINYNFSKNMKPKVASSIISLLITIIWFFPATINEHPVLSHYIDINNSGFNVFWGLCLVTTFFIWNYFIKKEKIIEKAYQYLREMLYQNIIFYIFIYFFRKNGI